ncbi:MAG: GvpL/GvpF family gas vesicle protein [Chloroflexi bacterium]|nr:GvpL/GvpF family gas vesicle protein [Chloroflexota bacterium]
MPAVPGLKVGANDHSPLFGVSYQDIAAVVSTLTSAKVQPTEANLWLHETVVEALMVDRAVLPVRFGTVLANEAAVQAVLTAHHADFVANLKRVRGRVELTGERRSRGAGGRPCTLAPPQGRERALLSPGPAGGGAPGLGQATASGGVGCGDPCPPGPSGSRGHPAGIDHPPSAADGRLPGR